MFKEILRTFSCNNKVTFKLGIQDCTNGIILFNNTADKIVQANGHTIFETGSSVVSKLDDGSILKSLKIRHWSEYHKLFLGKHRAKEEVLSNSEMQKIGLIVPKILYYGIFTNIFSKRLFSSFYAMEEVPTSFKPGNEIFESLNKKARYYFLMNITQDLKKLKENQLVYSDLSLRNFHINSDGESFWIDTQIKKYASKLEFINKFNYSLKRFCKESSLNLTIEEEKGLKELLH